MLVELYPSGVIKQKTKEGAFACILIKNGRRHLVSGFDSGTSENRMLLRGVIAGLVSLKKPCSVIVYIDSDYIYNGATKWIDDWIMNSWKTKSHKKVANSDLWKTINRLAKYHNIAWEEVGDKSEKIIKTSYQCANKALKGMR